MIYGSVCSGIEAATIAWHPLGWTPAWFSEIEAFPSRVLAHHYPGVHNHGDFTTIGASARPIDLLVGGTPCQSFSVAGLRGGLEDERGNLALEYCRLADRLRPRWVVWENVPGVLSIDGGRAFGSILGALVQLGYGVAYRVLDAQFYGVPQRRRRVFVVGYLGDWRRAAAVLFERSCLRWNPPTRRAKREATSSGAGRSTESGGRRDVTGNLGGGSGSRGWACDTDRMTFIPQTVTGPVTHTLRAEGFDASEDGTGRGTPIVAAPSPIAFNTTQITSKTNRSHPVACDTGHTLTAYPPAIAFHCTQDPVSGPVAPAIGRTTGGMGVAYDSEVRKLVRRLTPRECERLQGFPDDYTAIPGAADGPRYRALGNSMAVPVMRWIGERIARVDNIPR